MARPEVVELARAAVRRLSEAAPAAEDALAALASIERVGGGPPYTVAVAGDLAARTALLNCLAGEPLFDPDRHDPARVVMTLRRGAATTLRARRRDGSVEQLARAAGPQTAPTARSDPATGVAARAAAAGPGNAPAHDVDLGTAARVRRPPWWAFWRWLAVWFRAWWTRPRGLLPASTGSLASAPPDPPAHGAISDARSRGVGTVARTVERAGRGDPPRHQLVDALKRWFADEAVERVFVEVDGGPLPDKVVMIELPSRGDAMSLDAVVADACLVACSERGFAMTDQLETVMTIVPHLFVVGAAALPAGCDPRARLLGGFEAVAPELTRIATIERALAAGRRASAVLWSGYALLDRMVSDAESGFRVRVVRLEGTRIASPDDYTAAALARVRQAVVEHAHHGIRRALAQLDAAIDRFGADWSARLRDAASVDALRAAAAQLDEESPAVLQTAQAAALRALIDDLTEHAHAHYHELVSALRQGSTRADAVPSWLTIEVRVGDMTSGTKLGTVAPRLTSLFRSLDALKADAGAQLEQRIAKLRQVASANLRDAEPRLEPAVTGTLAIALRAEVERHAAWLEAELARERTAIDAERAQLTVLAGIRDAARTDHRQLTAALDTLAAELPGSQPDSARN